MKHYRIFQFLWLIVLLSSCSELLTEPMEKTSESGIKVRAMEYTEAIAHAPSLANAYSDYEGALRMVDFEDGYLESIGGYLDYGSGDEVVALGNIGSHDLYFYNIYQTSSDLSNPVLRQQTGISQVNFPILERGLSLTDMQDKRLSLHATAWANYALRMRQSSSYNPIYNIRGLTYLLLDKDPICNLYNPPYDLYLSYQHKEMRGADTVSNVRMDLLTSALRLNITIPEAAVVGSDNHRFADELEEIVAVVSGLPQTLRMADGCPLPSDSVYPSVNLLLGKYNVNSTLQSLPGLESLYGGGFALTPTISGNDVVFTGETTCFPQEEGAAPPQLRVYLKYRRYGFIFVLYPTLNYTLKAGIRNVVSLSINSEQSLYSYPSDLAEYMVDRAYPLFSSTNENKVFIVDMFNKEKTMPIGRVCSEYVKNCDEENPCIVYYAVKNDSAEWFKDRYSTGIVFKQYLDSEIKKYTAVGTFSSEAVYTPFSGTEPYVATGQYLNLSATPGQEQICLLPISEGIAFEPYCSYSPYILSDSRGSGVLREILSYKPVKIGTQLWASSSLATFKTDLTDLPLSGVLGNDSLSKTAFWKESSNTLPLYCFPNDKDSLRKEKGLLYNYLSASMADLYKEGCACPSSADWNTLMTYVGTSPSVLLDKAEGGSNLTGFSARFSGYRLADGRFLKIGNGLSLWLLDEGGGLSYTYTDSAQSSVSAMTDADKPNAHSIRYVIHK